MALHTVEDIMRYMIEIATGQNVVRSANPIAAAKFVYQMAGLDADYTPRTTSNETNVLAGLPEMVRFEIVGASPVLDEQGRLKIIEGELEEPDD